MELRPTCRFMIVLGALAFPGAAIYAQESAAGAQVRGDDTFVKEASSGGMAEVKLGQLAEQKGGSDAVKQFGKHMETDHSAANDKLKDVASKDGLTVSQDLNSEDQATYDRLSKLSGAEFDRAYAKDMVEDHQKDIAAFQKEASGGRNPDVKNFASQTLPTLQDHLKMARDMQRTVGGQ